MLFSVGFTVNYNAMHLQQILRKTLTTSAVALLGMSMQINAQTPTDSV